MIINNITNSIKSKINNLQKADQKKTLKIKDIVLIPEFEKMLAMDESVVATMTESMKAEGYKPGHEIHVWLHDGKYILIDGHTRKFVWESLGNKTIPCIVHHFADMEAATTYAIKEQINRRNLSGQALLDAVANFNFEKGKGNAGEEKGKASEIIGKQLGVSSKTVEKARVVLKEATEAQKEAIRKDELSVNQVYNQIRAKNPIEKLNSTQPKFSAKEKAFIDGIRYAIAQINSGTELKDLYHQTTDSFDYSKMSAILKDVDFTTLFSTEVPESQSSESEE